MACRHVFLALMLVLSADAVTAAKKKVASTPPPAPTPAPAPVRTDSALTHGAPTLITGTPGNVSLTPGPSLKPNSPIENRTTIVPFPIPGDTSRTERDLTKMMNRPREGMTLLEPMSPGVYGTPFRLRLPGGAPQPLDVLPEMLTQPAPEYPKAARDAGIQGIVTVMTLVDMEGGVREAHVVRSNPALDDAAIQAVKRMRFKPASYQGRPVPAYVGVPVRFTLH